MVLRLVASRQPYLRIIVRTGSGYRPEDLVKCNAGEANAIIVLTDHEVLDGDSNATVDMTCIKTLLALSQVPGAMHNNHAVLGTVSTLVVCADRVINRTRKP